MFEMTVKRDKNVGLELNKITGNINQKITGNFLKILFVVQREIQRSIAEWTSSTPFRSSGNLMRSFQPEIRSVSRGEISGGVFSDVVYARIHEDGGTIEPRTRKTLAFPFPGVDLPQGVGPLDFPDLQFVPLEGPNTRGMLVQKTGDDTFRPMFLLRKKVTIKPKRYLHKANKVASPKVREFTVELIKEALG